MRPIDGTKVTRLTLGGLSCSRQRCATGIARRRDGAAEVSRGRSSRQHQAGEGPNVEYGGASLSITHADDDAEMRRPWTSLASRTSARDYGKWGSFLIGWHELARAWSC
jgi:hypothetical protein